MEKPKGYHMSSDRRFNRDEINKILKRAAELERQHDISDDGEGLTAEELEKISREVGLHPRYVRHAIGEIDQTAPVPPSRISRLLGGPFTYFRRETVEGSVSEEELEDFISEIQQIQGKTGNTDKLSRTFKWEQRDEDIGYVNINLAPKSNHTDITINANYNDNAALMYGALGTAGTACCIILMAILYKKAGLPLLPLLTGGAVFIGSFFAGIRLYLSRFMEKKQQMHRRIFKRFRKVFTSKPAAENPQSTASPAVEFPPEVDEEQDSAITPEQQQRVRN